MAKKNETKEMIQARILELEKNITWKNIKEYERLMRALMLWID